MKRKIRKYIISEIFSKYTFADLTWSQEDFRVEDNIAEIDERLENLATFLDKELTEYEQERILEIVDEYTPKKDDGNYLAELLPFEYAWKILEAKKEIEIEKSLEKLKSNKKKK